MLLVVISGLEQLNSKRGSRTFEEETNKDKKKQISDKENHNIKMLLFQTNLQKNNKYIYSKIEI